MEHVFRRVISIVTKSKFLKRIVASITRSYGITWTLLALDEKGAMESIVGIHDQVEFDKSGEEAAEMLRQYLEPSYIVLDLGCGIGRIMKFLASYCKELHGVDASGRMVKFARKRLKQFANVQVHTNNGKDLSLFTDEKIDFVYAILVFPHLEKEDTCHYLFEINRVLKPSGRAYFQFANFANKDNCANFVKYVKTSDVRDISLQKIKYHTMQEVEVLMKATGFQIISAHINNEIAVLVQKAQS